LRYFLAISIPKATPDIATNAGSIHADDMCAPAKRIATESNGIKVPAMLKVFTPSVHIFSSLTTSLSSSVCWSTKPIVSGENVA